MAFDAYACSLDLLAAAPSGVGALATAVSPGLLDWRSTPDAWSVRNVLAHLLHAETGVTRPRIERMLAEDDPPIAPAPLLTPDGAALTLLAEWEAARTEDLPFFRALTAAQLARTGHHPVHGAFTVRDLVIELAYHDLDHLRQIAGIIQAALYPAIERLFDDLGA